ncbi:MAG TPA: phosphatase PAP2 family protein [Persephonella sp.]|nr:phosphatase PAP2 family protein [Persephonella sp.]
MPNDWQLKIKWNVKLFYLINSRRSRFLDRFYRYYFRLGKSYTLPVFLPFFYYSGGLESLIHLAIALLITGILMPSIKYTFRHKRPYVLLENVNLLEPVTLKSFPSADTAYAFTIFGVMLFYGSLPIILLFFVYAVLIAYGRVYMGAHFPIDVLTGGVIGFLSAVFGYAILGYLSF